MVEDINWQVISYAEIESSSFCGALQYTPKLVGLTARTETLESESVGRCKI